MLEAVLNHLNTHARIPLCGMISQYNQVKRKTSSKGLVPVKLQLSVSKKSVIVITQEAETSCHNCRFSLVQLGLDREIRGAQPLEFGREGSEDGGVPAGLEPVRRVCGGNDGTHQAEKDCFEV